jgi:hypothetical protein
VWGIRLNVTSDFDSTLLSLPPPSATRWLSKMDSTKTLQVLYHFQYMPQSWKEWQRIATIKIQMKELIPHIIFKEYEVVDGIERVYAITELGEYFTKFVKYQKPLYPSSKDEFMRSLALYAIRLYYEEQFYLESVLAMALHFNSKCDFGFTYRKLFAKTKSILMLNKENWKVKLSDDELRDAYRRRNILIAKQKQERSKPIKDKAILLRSQGHTLKSMSELLGVSISSVRRYTSK